VRVDQDLDRQLPLQTAFGSRQEPLAHDRPQPQRQLRPHLLLDILRE
jgi:hypothetical protein